MKNLSIVFIIMTITGLFIGIVEKFIPGFQDEFVGKIADSMLFGGLGVFATALAFAKTEKVWATNLLTLIGVFFSGLLISILICNWFIPEYNEASQNRQVNPEAWSNALFQGRMMWSCISSFILALRMSIKKRMVLD